MHESLSGSVRLFLIFNIVGVYGNPYGYGLLHDMIIFSKKKITG